MAHYQQSSWHTGASEMLCTKLFTTEIQRQTSLSLTSTEEAACICPVVYFTVLSETQTREFITELLLNE